MRLTFISLLAARRGSTPQWPCGSQWRLPCSARACTRSYFPSALPATVRRASGNGRSPLPETDTGSRGVSDIRKPARSPQPASGQVPAKSDSRAGLTDRAPAEVAFLDGTVLCVVSETGRGPCMHQRQSSRSMTGVQTVRRSEPCRSMGARTSTHSTRPRRSPCRTPSRE